MRIITGVFLLFLNVISSYEESKEIYYFPKEPSAIFIEAALKCITNFGYDSSIIDQNIMQGKYVEDDNTVKVMTCACVNTAFCHANGTQDVEIAMKLTYSTMQDIRPILEECNKDYGLTPVETFRAVVLCYREKLPIRLRFPK